MLKSMIASKLYCSLCLISVKKSFFTIRKLKFSDFFIGLLFAMILNAVRDLPAPTGSAIKPILYVILFKDAF